MLTLPLSTRAQQFADSLLQEEAAPLFDGCSASQETIVLNGLNFKVKNTFIDGESCEYGECELNVRKQRRAQTYTGEFSKLPLDQSIDDQSPSIPHAHTHASEFPLNDHAEPLKPITSGTFTFSIRNTFIEVKLPEQDCDAEFNMHLPGVSTCRASFEKLSPYFSFDDAVASTHASGSDISDYEGFDSTPFDDSPFGDASRRSFFPSANLAPIESNMSPGLSVTRPTYLCSALSSCSSFPKTCCHWKNKGFCKLGQTCKFAHPARKQGVGATQRKKNPSAVPLVLFPTQSADSISVALLTACEEKSDKVCCHWKNKGWCKYQASCKFQHPSHKQGVGSIKRVPTVSITA